MQRLLEAMWNPALGGFVVSVGLIVLLGSRLLPLRRAGMAARRSKGTTPSASGVLLAASTSVGALGSAVAAITLGGPGALVWMWITALLGIGLLFAETKLARADVASGKPSQPTWKGVLVLLLALVAGGAWQGQQIATVFDAASLETSSLGGVSAAVALALILWSYRASHKWTVVLVPLAALVGVMSLALSAALDDPLALQFALGDAMNHAFGLQAAAAGTVGGTLATVIAHGTMRAVTTANLGAGAAAAASTHDEDAQPADATAASMMWIPLVSVGLGSTTVALAMLTAPADVPLTASALYPLEMHESRGLRASQKVGQIIVLPEDTKLEERNRYAMTLRSDPRGHAMAKGIAQENAVILPAWTIAKTVDRVRFRAREPNLAKRASWDVEVPCNRETFGGEGGAPEFVKLTPIDPSVEFSKLVQLYELDAKPYINVSDFDFIGTVARANSPQDGEHLAMFEHRDDNTPFNPRLHEFYRNAFRGPYPTTPRDPDAGPMPWTFVAAEDFQGEIGDVVAVEFRPDPRGLDAVRVNRVGTAEAPPWRSMLDVHELVVRHETDPAQDERIPVAARLDGHRIRFDVLDPRWEDFRKLDADETRSGPYVVMPAARFEFEVHSDQRLPPQAKGRYALVPLNTDPVPRGPQERQLYDPHPSELIAAGFQGPYRPRDLGTLARRVETTSPKWGAKLFALFVVVLGASTALGWALLIRAPARQLFGEVLGKWFAGAVCVAPLLGGVLGAWVESAALLLYSVALVPTLGVLVLRLAELRADDTRPQS